MRIPTSIMMTGFAGIVLTLAGLSTTGCTACCLTCCPTTHTIHTARTGVVANYDPEAIPYDVGTTGSPTLLPGTGAGIGSDGGMGNIDAPSSSYDPSQAAQDTADMRHQAVEPDTSHDTTVEGTPAPNR